MPPEPDQTIDEKLHAWVVELNGNGDFVLAIEAGKFRRSLGEAEFSRWLHANADIFVADRMATFVRSLRGTAAARRKAIQFAALAGEAGADTVNLLDISYCVNAQHTWRPLREMVRADCEFVAEHRRQLTRANMLEWKFLEQVGKKLDGRKKVGDVYSEDELLALLRQIGGNE